MRERAFGAMIWLIVISALVACGGSRSDRATSPGTGAMPAIHGGRLLGHINVLASDEYEGRSPGSKGEELTVQYLSASFGDIAVEPGNPDGTYTQAVPLVGMTPDPAMTLTFEKGSERKTLRYLEDFVAWTKRVVPDVRLASSELVFVGYGVQAPELGWDDYKGLDVAGKTLVMLVNDPQVTDAAGKLDDKMFGGRAMTYYGRWTYKYEIGAKLGAAAVLIIHDTEGAGYPWDVVRGFGGERFDLVAQDKNLGRAVVEGWITTDQAKALMGTAGQSLDALRAQAVRRDFKPVPLGVTASIAFATKQRAVASRNIIAKITGSDLANEYVIYTAHWDHLGVGEAVNGDRIYNGAIDNASGTAALLEIARALQDGPRPRRTILFIAVTAEEQGLLGSEHYAQHPLYPLARTVAVFNMDAMNVYGRTKDVTIVGFGMSDLDDYARDAAAAMGRTLRPDPRPERGGYYRSDHFNFAKAGVPALYLGGGVDFIGKPEGYGLKLRNDYTEHRYHQPSDEVQPDWDLGGLIEDLQILTVVGRQVANAPTWPAWKPGTEFRAIREATLQKP